MASTVLFCHTKLASKAGCNRVVSGGSYHLAKESLIQYTDPTPGTCSGAADGATPGEMSNLPLRVNHRVNKGKTQCNFQCPRRVLRLCFLALARAIVSVPIHGYECNRTSVSQPSRHEILRTPCTDQLR